MRDTHFDIARCPFWYCAMPLLVYARFRAAETSPETYQIADRSKSGKNPMKVNTVLLMLAGAKVLLSNNTEKLPVNSHQRHAM